MCKLSVMVFYALYFFMSVHYDLLEKESVITMAPRKKKTLSPRRELAEAIIREYAPKSAELVIRLFPDNEVARLALLRLNYDKTGYIEDYLKKYPNDIYGQYFYLYVHNQLEGEEADKIIKRAREMISEDEFYSIVTPSVVLDSQLVATPNLYTKAGILWDMFADVCDVAMVSSWDPLKDFAPANRIIYIYSQPNYVLSSDKGKKILDDYVKKYPPEYFITKRDLEK